MYLSRKNSIIFRDYYFIFLISVHQVFIFHIFRLLKTWATIDTHNTIKDPVGHDFLWWVTIVELWIFPTPIDEIFSEFDVVLITGSPIVQQNPNENVMCYDAHAIFSRWLLPKSIPSHRSTSPWTQSRLFRMMCFPHFEIKKWF